MRKISGDFIFPVSDMPVRNGILITDDYGMVVEKVIDPLLLDYTLSDVEHYPGFICPGFINAHCHLELSYFQKRIKEHQGLGKFIIELERVRKSAEEEETATAIISAEEEMMSNGIVAVGDICNNSSTFEIKNKSKIIFHSFIESFASASQKANTAFEKAVALYDEICQNSNNNRASITPHSTYSLSKDLFLFIKDFAEKSGNIISIHHQESEEENLFFLAGKGNISEIHSRSGIEKSGFCNSGQRPLLSIAGYLPKDNPLQLVHNTVSDESDIVFADNYFSDLYWCFCPNANLYIEQKLPDFALFFNKKCRITIGTDSLASNKSLSILKELKTIRSNVPYIPLNTMLSWATINGADFLQLSSRLGSFDKGKMPGVLLLENVDTDKLHITRDTSVKVLV